MKVRGGHPFGLMQISKIAKFKWFKWQKIWCTLSIIYSINPRGCPPLATISLVQAVVISFYCRYNVKRILQTILKFFVVIWLLLIANINSALYCDRRKQMTSEFFNDVNRVVPKNIVSRKKKQIDTEFFNM